MTDFLVEPDWLQQRLGKPGIAVLDCSWFVPEANRSGIADFRQGHIPGARFFDLDAASDKTSPFVNMLPGAAQFEAEARRLGVNADTTVIIYDSSYVSARVWWMFRLFGHGDVRILNGGWKRWKAENRPIETGDPKPVEAGSFRAVAPKGGVAVWQDVLAAIRTGKEKLVDARTKERFTGEMPSGYPGVAGGHMPGAINVPWSKMIRQGGDFGFVDPAEAASIFKDAGVDLAQPIISTCGSGVTAAVLAFQMLRLGKTDWRIYDASWHEWGQREDLPKESV
jgi:thiosulfate/3-mercaptopyruvate sulfurtransferase